MFTQSLKLKFLNLPHKTKWLLAVGLAAGLLLIGLAVTMSLVKDDTPLRTVEQTESAGESETTNGTQPTTDIKKTVSSTQPTAKKPTETTTTKSSGASAPAQPTPQSPVSTSPAPVPAPAQCPNAQHTAGGSDGLGGCWPYAGNTGVPTGTVLSAYTGPCSITSDTLIENKTVNCALQMYSNASLTVRRSVVNGFIDNTSTTGPGKLLVEDSEIHSGAWQGGSVWGSYITANRVEVTGGQHSVQCESNCTVNDSWLHNQYNPDGQGFHNNAFISNGGANMVVKHNTLHCTAILNATDGGCTADLSLFGDFDTISFVTVDSNLMMANNSSISFCAYGGYSPAKPYPNANNIIFKNNIFQRGSNNLCGVYGAITSFQTSAPGNLWSNNKWSDGAVLSP